VDGRRRGRVNSCFGSPRPSRRRDLLALRTVWAARSAFAGRCDAARSRSASAPACGPALAPEPEPAVRACAARNPPYRSDTTPPPWFRSLRADLPRRDR
jgi:hypothetical protein